MWQSANKDFKMYFMVFLHFYEASVLSREVSYRKDFAFCPKSVLLNFTILKGFQNTHNSVSWHLPKLLLIHIHFFDIMWVTYGMIEFYIYFFFFNHISIIFLFPEIVIKSLHFAIIIWATYIWEVVECISSVLRV